MLEIELRDVESLDPVMNAVEDVIRYLADSLRASVAGRDLLEFYGAGKKHPDEEIVNLEDRWSRLTMGQWERISYGEAMDALIKASTAEPASFQTVPTWETGLHLEHERWIAQYLGKGQPIFVTDYPTNIKPFYMLPSQLHREPTGRATVACFDLLFPFGYCEIAGGSLREHRLQNLIQNMREHGMIRKRVAESSTSTLSETLPSFTSYPFLEPDEDLGNLTWYADLRRYGSSPHGGFGMGLDRLLAYLTGVSNVRDIVPFPRTWGKADC